MKKSLLILFISMVTLLHGDYIIEYDMDGEKMKFMYKDATTSKMITGSDGEKVEIYNINKNTYVVSHTQDGVSVVDLNAMRQMMKEMGRDPSMYMQAEPEPEYKIKKTNKKVNIAGIKGVVWILMGEEDGEKFKEEVVVTDDKKVLKTLRAMFESISSMSGGMAVSNNFFELEDGYMMIQADEMKLESFSSKKISPDEYKLP